ncbi:MAG: SDR family NAD(P)-dependent oxidoreductase [Deltaproteobacteria bacterium]|nr:SDR family NAD(P)-dependent oxidoreductase [Deltaproteobacteria bacterium]
MPDVIVTGGTGALGRALVEAFAARGDRVVVPWILSRERDAVSALWSDLPVELVEADISEDTGARAVAEAAGACTVLVNAAGGFAMGGDVDQTPLEMWDALYRVNLRTAVAMTRAVLPGMRERKQGAIVNVTAAPALGSAPGIAAYGASKAGVALLTRSLQEEVAADGIRVNAIVPTTIDTPTNRQSMPNADFSAWTPPGRIAEVVLWLTSDAAATVRGALVPV